MHIKILGLIVQQDSVHGFSSFSEPTRSILRATYDAGDYEVISDSVPTDALVLPNWQAWQLAVLGNSAAVTAFNALPTMLTASLITLIGQVADKPETITAIAALWSQISTAIPANVRTQIKDAAIASNLPSSFINVI